MNPGTCIHYNGILGATETHRCNAGVCYHEAFDGSTPGIMLRQPCMRYRVLPKDGIGTYIRPGQEVVIKEIDRRGQTMIPCEHFREPTPEEIEADRLASEASLQKTLIALKVAGEWRVKPKPEQDRAEVVECPICKGRLHLSQSSYNGHVWGKCETDGCVEWME